MRDAVRRFCFSSLAALLLLMASFAYGQTITTADAVGVVTDTSGAVVPGATVTIKSTDRANPEPNRRTPKASIAFR